MEFLKIPAAFLIWSVSYGLGAYFLSDMKWMLFSSSLTFFYLSFMCYQLYLLHKRINKEKAENKKMLAELEVSIKKHESYVKQQIELLKSIERKRDSSIKRLN